MTMRTRTTVRLFPPQAFFQHIELSTRWGTHPFAVSAKLNELGAMECVYECKRACVCICMRSCLVICDNFCVRFFFLISHSSLNASEPTIFRLPVEIVLLDSLFTRWVVIDVVLRYVLGSVCCCGNSNCNLLAIPKMPKNNETKWEIVYRHTAASAHHLYRERLKNRHKRHYT